LRCSHIQGHCYLLLFGPCLSIRQGYTLENKPAPDTSVSCCHVYDTFEGRDALIGRIFFDIYTREGKIDGEAAYSVRAPILGRQSAEVVLFANVSAQAGACLSFTETKNLLHDYELGHAAHCLLGAQRYAQFAGIGESAAQKDFTEAPSQMLEHWLEDARSLEFAVNKKGERIPGDVIGKLLAAEKIGRGSIERNWLLVKAKYAVSPSVGEQNGSSARIPTAFR
jgi:Zn-dependent oligopeptidase